MKLNYVMVKQSAMDSDEAGLHGYCCGFNNDSLAAWSLPPPLFLGDTFMGICMAALIIMMQASAFIPLQQTQSCEA